MEQDGKTCSCCQKFKSAEEFYRQGDRLESRCKECKRKARGAKREHPPEPERSDLDVPVSPEQPPAEKKGPPKTYEDLGFTKEEFLEIVDFFQELMRLDQKGRSK